MSETDKSAEYEARIEAAEKSIRNLNDDLVQSKRRLITAQEVLYDIRHSRTGPAEVRPGRVRLTDDGGPAFPRTEDAISSNNREFDLDGMSLRAYLAAKAISVVRPVYEVTSEPQKPEDGQLPPFSKIRAAVIAREACEVADALIAELEGKAEIQAPDAEAFKFELEQKVRLKQREPYRFDENEGVVKTRKLRDGLPAYELLVFVKGHRGSSWWSEDKLEAVEDDGPKFMPVRDGKARTAAKFEKGDPVQVVAGPKSYYGLVGTVELAVNEPLRGWVYRVDLPVGIAGKVEFLPENCLEAAGDAGEVPAAAKFKEGDRVWVKPGAMGKFSCKVAVVESFTYDLKGWCYKVWITEGTVRVYDTYYEICLESQEERAREE